MSYNAGGEEVQYFKCFYVYEIFLPLDDSLLFDHFMWAIIDRMPGYSNGYVATGHAMLGLTLAPATADLTADYITRGESDIDSTAFDPARFARPFSHDA